ncbi:ribonuclease III (RNase III) [Mycoplasmopsis maculosa]|uniref:Ribonuclease 3 n=1 Tax=Mycoplasmopsis maculosa TaxID=114885 RepID=A0A449B5M7_9BACT|nr:ribonuclease III [Mycoplasmopsis maculosa]VEU75828.1 ribonuclease III (RNase III) [Mycoplasmopsis maculosa]
MQNYNENLILFLKSLGLKVNNINNYVVAFTHGSYIHSTNNKDKKKSYETLEFLGDAILQFLVSDYIYKNYQNTYEQGKMTLSRSMLVRTETLNNLTDKLRLKHYVLTGNGNMKSEILQSKKVGADLFEALVAAIYLDEENIESVKNFLNKTLFKLAFKITDSTVLKDYKTFFQEHVQSYSKVGAIYKTFQNENKEFESEVIHEGKIYGRGTGSSKLKAEEEAAKNALEKLKK